MAGGAHVGVDATVRSVGAPTHFGSLVDLDVLDHQRIHVKALGGEGKVELVTCFSLQINNLHVTVSK